MLSKIRFKPFYLTKHTYYNDVHIIIKTRLNDLNTQRYEQAEKTTNFIVISKPDLPHYYFHNYHYST